MAWLWRLPSLVVIVLVAGGPLGAYTGALSPGSGFSLFLLGFGVAALSTLGLGGAAAIGAALGRSWRRSAVLATLVPLVVMLAVLIPNAQNPAPTINDITTDPDDPPSFVQSEAQAVDYPESFREVQRAAYPDLSAFESPAPLAEVFRHAVATAEAMPRWEVTLRDEARGLIQAVATSRLFRFRDDIVIRLRPGPPGAGTRVDVRSRSRVGRGDLGANAARIRAYQDALRRRLASR